MYITAITGASGSILGIRLIEELLRAGQEVSAIVSGSAWKIIQHEILNNKEKASALADILKIRKCGNLKNFREYKNDDFFSPFASGTSRFRAIIIIPCSMKTLAGVASGYADNLINRAADVALKENRKCILVPRESPLNLIHIENLLKAKQAGADIVMPVPPFYANPKTIDDVVDFIVGKVLSLLGIEHELFTPWGE